MKTRIEETAVAAVYGLFGWTVAAAAASLALWKTTSPNAPLAAHAIMAPVAFLLVSFVYFRRERPLGGLAAGLVFAVLFVFLDLAAAFVLGRPLDTRSLLLGVWLPAYSVFLATWAAGLASSLTAAARRPL